MIDTHCHLDAGAFDADREQVIARAREAGVQEMVVPSIGPAGWEPLLSWAERRQGIHVAVGIHPQLLPELSEHEDERHLARLDELLATGKACAVGECGLDGPTTERASMERQRRVFEAHLALGRKYRLPVLVHCLRAHDELQRILASGPMPVLVLHSFSGSAEQVRQYLRWEVAFSFAGPVTWPNARKPLAAARAVPRDRLVVETDAPDQAPHPHKGRCEPAHVANVVAGLAAALGLSVEEADALTTANARRWLGLR